MPAVPKPVRKERAARLREAGQAAARAFFATQRDRIVSILTETGHTGHTEHFAPVRLVARDHAGRAARGPGHRHRGRRVAGGGGLMALGSFFNRLKEGLSRSTSRITETLTTVFKKRRLDDEALEELEELLISADLGVDAAARVIAAFRRSRFGKEVTDEEIKQALAEEIAAILAAGGETSGARSGAQAACGAGGRRQRHRQDDDDRQAGAAVSRRGQARGAGRRRYVPRGGGGAIADLGAAHRRAGDRGRAERRLGRAGVRRADQGARPTAPTCC